MTKLRHVMGISGGKDSAALAIYLRNKYPELDVQYYFCDTGCELEETYQFVRNLEIYLGKPISILKAAKNSPENPFDHYLSLHGGYLPSSNSRWCTRKLKLEPFEEFVGNDTVISYVGIREDENRDAYVSSKPNIQSIFPFRKNIWSNEIIHKLLKNENIGKLSSIYKSLVKNIDNDKDIMNIVDKPLSMHFNLNNKLQALLMKNIPIFNKVVFEYLKKEDHPLSKEDTFPLLEKTDSLVREDIFKILEESGVGIPKYYLKKEYDIDGKKGYYARSRSGCYFCFFQKKIEWVWLYEQHPDLFQKAMKYEKSGFSWMQDEKLSELIKPERISEIKKKHFDTTCAAEKNSKSIYLLDILKDAEGQGCTICTI